ncbi:MAG: hypothetical protein Q9194_006983 [Teloschistes cf. exilis]
MAVELNIGESIWTMDIVHRGCSITLNLVEEAFHKPQSDSFETDSAFERSYVPSTGIDCWNQSRGIVVLIITYASHDLQRYGHVTDISRNWANRILCIRYRNYTSSREQTTGWSDTEQAVGAGWTAERVDSIRSRPEHSERSCNGRAGASRAPARRSRDIVWIHGLTPERRYG